MGKLKISCCKDCKDRVVEPNCHMTCEKYLQAKAAADQETAAKIKAALPIAYTRESIRRIRYGSAARQRKMR